MGKKTAQYIKPYEYKPGESGNPNGRPKKFLSTLKSIGYTTFEVTQTLKNIASLDEDGLKEIIDRKDSTVLEKIFATNLHKSIKKGNLSGLEILLNRAFGYPHESAPEPGDPPDSSKPLPQDANEAARQYQEIMK